MLETKLEIGALFDEYLNLSQPFSQIITAPAPTYTNNCSYNPAQCMPQPPSGSMFNNHTNNHNINQTDEIVTSHPSSPLTAPPSPSPSPYLSADSNYTPEASVKREQPTKKRKKKAVEEANDDNDSDCITKNKKARRRKQNRMAAQTSREKKKRYLTTLEDTVANLRRQNDDLVAQLKQAQNENLRLRSGGAEGSPAPVKTEPSTPCFDPSSCVKLESLDVQSRHPNHPNPELATEKRSSPVTFESAARGDQGASFFPAKFLDPDVGAADGAHGGVHGLDAIAMSPLESPLDNAIVTDDLVPPCDMLQPFALFAGSAHIDDVLPALETATPCDFVF